MYIDEATGCPTIDLGGNWKLSLSDDDHSIQNFEDYIENIGWRYNNFAVRKIFDANIPAKADINAILRNHPNYVEHLKGVVLLADSTRDIDITACSEFNRWLSRKAMRIARDNAWDDFLLGDALYYLSGEFTQNMDASYSVERLEHIFQTHTEYGLQKLHVHSGQKRSKLVWKFCKMLGIDKDEDFQKMFSKYGDAINPKKIKLPTLIGTNANDFVRMSDGAGARPWRSCHNPDKSAYSGCNCSGGISHALDNTSIIMYTIPENCWDFQTARKVNRCIFFAGRDSDGNISWFVQSKVYPDGTKQKSDEFREIFQKVWSECTGNPNLWTKGNMGDDWARIYLNDDATLYPDFEYCDRNIIVPFHQVGLTTEEFQPIYAGEAPICVECGCRHDYKDEINCCHSFQAGWTCPECDSQWDDEGDGSRYSYFHDATGCSNCMSWSNIAEDYFFDSEEWSYVRNIRESVPVSYMERHGSQFAKCEECGEWVYIGDDSHVYSDGFYTDADGDIYCNSCAEYVLRYCEDCGEYYRADDMVEIDGELYCEECAEARREKSEEAISDSAVA